MTDTLSRGRGDRYALSALKHSPASIASDLVATERKIRHVKEALVHVDATLLLLDPEANPEGIPNKRPVGRIKLFRQGELGRMILDALRDAPGGLSTAEIVTALLVAGGHGGSARRTMAPRVRGNLARFGRRRLAVKSGNGRTTRWALA